ncbi:MAG: molybdopterin-dependent oxidoreductase, partial [Spirochaetales bacterium]|nr:molybdopterin-dependent oxidoreductase [Spirochaetales bacterium]
MTINFTLNNETRRVDADPAQSLQKLLKGLGIHSVRISDDGEGFVGSDTILFDGKPVLAGLMVAGQAEGHGIETIESLMGNGRMSVIQEALLDAGAVQSAYNIPATALLIEELLRRIDKPDEADIREALSGVFNRATGYKQFFLAVQIARERLADPDYATQVAPEFRDDLRIVGKNARRIDGVKLVAGMKAFVEDSVEPGSCLLKILRSPHAHAYIEEIDTAEALALPGVVTVISHENCPDVWYCQSGQGFPEPTPYDRRMFSQKVRHVGDRVAAVVAFDEDTADRALELIKVRYQVLEPAVRLDDAIAVRGTPIHGGPALLADGGIAAETKANADPREGKVIYQFNMGADPAQNLAARAFDGIGDLNAGFAEADCIVEHTYNSSKIQCTPLEPHVVYTRMDGDRLIIHASTQVPWHLRRIVATVLGIKENRIRVIKERIGGGYGSKQDILLEEVCAYATYVTGKSIFYKYTREEEFNSAT